MGDTEHLLDYWLEIINVLISLSKYSKIMLRSREHNIFSEKTSNESESFKIV